MKGLGYICSTSEPFASLDPALPLLDVSRACPRRQGRPLDSPTTERKQNMQSERRDESAGEQITGRPLGSCSQVAEATPETFNAVPEQMRVAQGSP